MRAPYTRGVPPSQDDTDKVLKFAQAQAAEAAELRLQVKHLERRLRRAESRLRTIESSWTWKVGRVVLLPVTIARFVRRRTHRE
jgi:hypothetical protein